MQMSGFRSFDEASQYARELFSAIGPSGLLEKVKPIAISEKNLQLLGTNFSYKDYDGIYGKFVLEEKNHVETTVTVESRFPMPSITIDGSVYPLDADFESEDGNIIIDAASDFTTVKVDTYETAPTDITLPNGKTLKVKLGDTGNTFDYTVDGVTKTFTPTVTYTGYYAGYEELWTPIKGEDLTTYTPEFTLTGAGTDKTAVILKAAITHEPLEGLTPAGNQIFKHSGQRRRFRCVCST